MLQDRAPAVTGRQAELRRWLVDAATAILVGGIEIGVTSSLAAHRSLSITPVGYALLGAGALALVARRRLPVAVLAVTYATTFAYQATDNPSGAIWLAVIVAFGTAVYLRRRIAAVGFLVAGYVGFLWGPSLVHLRHHRAPPATFALGLAVGLLVLLGASEGIRLRRQRALAVQHGREQEVLRRAGEERLRIARDLHDVVAHSIAVINVQANTALHLMDRQPERARQALSAINDVSKQTLVELRAALGPLRRVEETAPLAPAPTLARLGELAASMTAGGLQVQLEQRGEPGNLPAEVDLAAYRIVQEALTNTARHCDGPTARVTIEYGPQDLRVTIEDDGPFRRPVRTNAEGNGILGMTERAKSLGGDLSAGPGAGGGFRVRAVLPLGPGR
jgi:signal transduction histidine kinase